MMAGEVRGMHLALCIKQVPQKAEVIAEEGRYTLARQGVPSQINFHDLAALEMALKLKRGFPLHVTVLTMGPPSAEEALREALALGADKGILITHQALSGSDTLATSRVLAAALRRLRPSPSVVLFGARSSDSDTGHVPPQVAEDLHLPFVSCATNMEVSGQELLVWRRFGRWIQTLRVKLPALVSVLGMDFKPRQVNIREIPLAFEEKEVLVWGLKEIGLKEEEVGLQGSATRVRRIRLSDEKRRGQLFKGPPQGAVRLILRALEDKGVL